MVYHKKCIIMEVEGCLMEEDYKSGQERKEELQEKILRDIEDLKETTDQAEKEGWY